MSAAVSDSNLAEKMFHFTCFNVEDPDDPAVGLVNGEVTIPGNLLRREVFDPVVNQVRLATLLLAGCAPSVGVSPSDSQPSLTARHRFSLDRFWS